MHTYVIGEDVIAMENTPAIVCLIVLLLCLLNKLKLLVLWCDDKNCHQVITNKLAPYGLCGGKRDTDQHKQALYAEQGA